MIERERPERRPFVPRKAWIALLVIGGLFVAGIVVAILLAGSGTTTVPDLVGLDEQVALVNLRQAKLEMTVSQRPFDRSPAGTVLAQEPEAGSVLKEGETVTLVVSAGTEEFEMPDVVGLAVRIARAQLEQRGLVVRIEAVESDAPKDTVLSSNPAPGATVRTTDIVRLTVAAEGSASEALLPYALNGMVFVLDPSAVTTPSIDVPLEVARRLRSLLEASGATVHATRSAAATDTTPAGRAATISGISATALIGLDVGAAGSGGVAITTLSESAAPGTYQSSRALADKVEALFVEDALSVERATVDVDPVVGAAQKAAIRIRLGSFADPEDEVLFRDPAWADRIARLIYRALGESLGAQ